VDTHAVLVRKIDTLEMNVNKYPFTQRKRSDAHETIKEDRKRKASSVLLSVGNIFYYISEPALNVSLAKVVLLLTKQAKGCYNNGTEMLKEVAK
jgi:hypothetical protein